MDYLTVGVVLVFFVAALYFLLLNSNQEGEAEMGVKGGEAETPPPGSAGRMNRSV